MDRVMPLLLDELGRIVRRALPADGGCVLQTRELVDEAYDRLIDTNVALDDRIPFMALAARAMRRILTTHARGRLPRRSEALKVAMTDAALGGPARGPVDGVHVLDLHEALVRLARRDTRKAQLLELLYFGGLTYEEAAAALSMSRATLCQELQPAKAWIARALTFPAA